jgi:alkaline phosphatase D
MSSSLNQPCPSTDFWTTILLSLPSASRRIRITHFVVNTLLLLAAVEFVIHPFFDPATDTVFTRVGAVYPDSVKIVVRYPEHNATESRVRVIWREYKEIATDEDGWKHGPVLKLTEAHDWVSTTSLRSLWPSTSYECELGLSSVRVHRFTSCSR